MAIYFTFSYTVDCWPGWFEGLFACYQVVTNNDTDRDTAASRCEEESWGHLTSLGEKSEIVHMREILDLLLNSTNITETDIFYTELKWDGENIVYADGSSLELPVHRFNFSYLF